LGHYYYYYHYAAFNVPCVGHKDDESQGIKDRVGVRLEFKVRVGLWSGTDGAEVREAEFCWRGKRPGGEGKCHVSSDDDDTR